MSQHRGANLHHEHRGKSSKGLLDTGVILKSLNITPGETILDAGCGDGYMAKEFAKYAGTTGKVYALDPDDLLINTLKSETAGTIIEPFVADITKKTRLANASIDLIFVSTVLHGFSELQMDGFLYEVRRLMKPGGRLAVVEFKKTASPFGPPLDIRYSPKELRHRIGLIPASLHDVGRYFYMQLFGNEK
jgi:ubiquinone/menaquinone biosynthesis C-methylase UbiE